MSVVTSPLVSEGPVDRIRTIDVASIVEGWRRFGCDVSRCFNSIQKLHLYRCRVSQLQFYHPCPIGDESLYAAIGKQPWYYGGDKWEFRAAVAAIQQAGLSRVMEIGCGSGKFLRYAETAGLEASGLDMNVAAVQAAREAGLAVASTTLAEAASRGLVYDVVCAFQVLEHVAQPIDFITDIVRLTKPNGLVVFCTPDGDGWLGERLQLLDLPPHHALRWGRAAYQFLTNLFPLHLESISTEPLSPTHMRDWALATLDPDPHDETLRVGRPAPFRTRLAARGLALLRDTWGTRRAAGGQSLMAVFRRHG